MKANMRVSCHQLTIALLLGLFAFVATGSPTSAQIMGRVVDVWGNPVAGATVSMPGFRFEAHTDANGTYKLDYAPGSIRRFPCSEPGDRDKGSGSRPSYDQGATSAWSFRRAEESRLYGGRPSHRALRPWGGTRRRCCNHGGPADADPARHVHWCSIRRSAGCAAPSRPRASETCEGAAGRTNPAGFAIAKRPYGSGDNFGNGIRAACGRA